MKAALQRIKSAHIIVNDQLVSSSKQGLLAFVGIEDNDTEKDVDSMVQRILQTTLWAEECEPKSEWNKSIQQIDGDILCIPQFTFHRQCRNRNASGPSDITDFIRIHHQYQCLVKKLSNTYRPERVKSGVLEAMMALPFIEDAPIRIYYESTDSVVTVKILTKMANEKIKQTQCVRFPGKNTSTGA